MMPAVASLRPMAEALRPLSQWLRPLLDAAAPSPGLRRLLPGLLAVALAALLFPVLGPGGADRRVAAATLALAGQLAQDDLAVRRELQDAPAPAAASAPLPVEAPQAFLKQFVDAANGAGLRITRLSPRPPDARLLDVEAAATYPELLHFVTDMELLHATFHVLRVHEPVAATGRQEVAFVLGMPDHATAPGAQAAEAARARAAASDPALRNPFAAPPPQGAGPVLDYRLTGITQVGGTLSATIDGRDYQQGDRLGDMVVGAIRPDEVSLREGSRSVWLRFAAPR